MNRNVHGVVGALVVAYGCACTKAPPKPTAAPSPSTDNSSRATDEIRLEVERTLKDISTAGELICKEERGRQYWPNDIRQFVNKAGLTAERLCKDDEKSNVFVYDVVPASRLGWPDIVRANQPHVLAFRKPGSLPGDQACALYSNGKVEWLDNKQLNKSLAEMHEARIAQLRRLCNYSTGP